MLGYWQQHGWLIAIISYDHRLKEGRHSESMLCKCVLNRVKI